MAVRTRCGRVVRPKTNFEDLKAMDAVLKQEEECRRKYSKKLWVVEEVRERSTDGKVLVKWMDFGEEFNSWVSLAKNPELASYLAVNAGNPDSSAVAQHDLPPLSEEDRELWLVKHAVFDELQFRRTPENDLGLSRRVQVKVPFTKRAFTTLFGKGTFLLPEERKLDFSGNRNVRFSCTIVEIASVIGPGAFQRQFSDSSTICEADPCSKVWVSWGYDLRVNYDHSSCPRCTHTFESGERPPHCVPSEVKMPPISYLEISFKSRRRNMILQVRKIIYYLSLTVK